jgi:hypothetical protein
LSRTCRTRGPLPGPVLVGWRTRLQPVLRAARGPPFHLAPASWRDATRRPRRRRHRGNRRACRNVLRFEAPRDGAPPETREGQSGGEREEGGGVKEGRARDAAKPQWPGHSGLAARSKQSAQAQVEVRGARERGARAPPAPSAIPQGAAVDVLLQCDHSAASNQASPPPRPEPGLRGPAYYAAVCKRGKR